LSLDEENEHELIEHNAQWISSERQPCVVLLFNDMLVVANGKLRIHSFAHKLANNIYVLVLSEPRIVNRRPSSTTETDSEDNVQVIYTLYNSCHVK
jgi:hypothetical protein